MPTRGCVVAYFARSDAGENQDELLMGHDPKSKNQGQLQDNANTGLLDDVVITRDYMLDSTVALEQPKSGFRVGTDAVFLAASVGRNGGRIQILAQVLVG